MMRREWLKLIPAAFAGLAFWRPREATKAVEKEPLDDDMTVMWRAAVESFLCPTPLSFYRATAWYDHPYIAYRLRLTVGCKRCGREFDNVELVPFSAFSPLARLGPAGTCAYLEGCADEVVQKLSRENCFDPARRWCGD